MSKWSNFVRGEPARQEVLEVALDWIAQRDGVSIDNYMAKHRDDEDCKELQTYFTTVIDWAASVFKMTDSSMRGIAWNKLYEQYGDKGYDAAEMTAEARELLSDSQVQSKKGIYEYLLGGKKETRLLSVRVFTEAVKKRVYKRQTLPRRTVSRTARIAPSVTRGSRRRSGRLRIWTPITSPHGRRAARPRKATASCSASPTIAPKVTLNQRRRGDLTMLRR